MNTVPLNFIRGRKKKADELPRVPKPEWLKVRAPGSENYHRLKGLMRGLGLHTALHVMSCVVVAPVTGGNISPDKARLDFDIDMSLLDEIEREGFIKKLYGS